MKAHARPLHGTVARINVVDGYGFIETPDGDEHTFDRFNLAGGARLEQLRVGREVQFITTLAAQGAQAKRVSLGKHHAATMPAPPGAAAQE
ncbi:MAG: hypothetical protein C0505_00805 [Leptothrix sp. (in: Bacteria)]|nr:hypothetical protein [Leptothrix sp. (in: b-proteobacteria)]